MTRLLNALSTTAWSLATALIFLAILAVPSQTALGDDPECGPGDPEKGYVYCPVGEICVNGVCVAAGKNCDKCPNTGGGCGNSSKCYYFQQQCLHGIFGNCDCIKNGADCDGCTCNWTVYHLCECQ